jgi:hypothetical protein
VVDVVARDHPMATHDTMHQRRDVQQQHQIPAPLTWSATCRRHLSISCRTGLMVALPKLVCPLEAPTKPTLGGPRSWLSGALRAGSTLDRVSSVTSGPAAAIGNGRPCDAVSQHFPNRCHSRSFPNPIEVDS